MIPVTFSRHENPALAEQIRRDVEAHLKAGGKIKKLKSFCDVVPPTPTKSRATFNSGDGKKPERINKKIKNVLTVKFCTKDGVWYVYSRSKPVSQGFYSEAVANIARKRLQAKVCKGIDI